MGLDENIAYLAAQKQTLERIQERTIGAIAAIDRRRSAVVSYSGELRGRIRSLRKTLISAGTAPSEAAVRERLVVEERLRNRIVALEEFEAAMPDFCSLATRWRDLQAQKKELKSDEQSAQDGEALDLSGFYIVFTSNLGAAELLNLQHSSFTTMERHVLTKAQRSLRPELYARITEKIVFSRLSYDVQLDIAGMHIARELALLRDQGFDLVADESVVSFLIQRGFHPRLGARPLRDAVEKYLRGAVADAMLAEVSFHRGEFVVCADELLLRPIPEPTTAFEFAG